MTVCVQTYGRKLGLCFSTQKQLFVLKLAVFYWYPSLEYMDNSTPCLSSSSGPRRSLSLRFFVFLFEAYCEKFIVLLLIDQ